MNKKHMKCWLWKGLWVLGALAFVMAWISTKSGAVYGLGTAHWFWDALILGVLSISIKLDCHDCGVCKN